MKNGRKIAREYLSYGLNPLPIDPKVKNPMNKKHNTVPMTEESIEEYDFDAIGISTGILSGGLEAIDFDLKNAEHPKAVMKVFKSKVSTELLRKLVVQQTPSGYLHFIYRCETVSSSKKLAKNPEGIAIIETRGEGGLIKCAPSEGYKLVQGSFDKIPIITPEERLQLLISAKMLNQLVHKDASKRFNKEDSKYFKKFPEYNNDIEIGVGLLEKHGWTRHTGFDSEWVNLTRPNKDISEGISAGYHKTGKFLYVFSTGQNSFEEEKPYNNHAIFAELECGGNYAIAYGKLFDEGHGVDSEDFDLDEADWEESLEKLTFLSDDIDENTYLEQARKDEIEQGLPTGWVDLDDFYRFKENTLDIGLGYDGVGKGLFTLSLATAANVLHGWKWGMIMPENKTGMSRRRLIESISGRSIQSFKDSPAMYEKYKQECRDNFYIIANKKHYTLRDVLEMGKRLYEVHGIKALLIDPWNFFKVEGNSYSYNNEILSELRVFVERYCSVYIMAHPSSEAPRKNKDEHGFLKAPDKYSIQGGADFPYRVDNFFIMHRIVNHPDGVIKRTMQFRVEKMKELETGGAVHDLDSYSSLVWEVRNGFLGYWDTQGNNPMYAALKLKKALSKPTTIKEAF